MRFIYLIFFFFIFSSCFYQTPDEAFYNTNFSKDFNKISKDFCKHIKYRKVILADIVHYQTLKPTPKGEFLTEFLRDSIVNQCNVSVYQIELREKFKANNIGITALSRKPHDIKNKKFRARYLITGTYSITENFVTVFIRLIDIKKGKVILSKTKKILYHIPNPMDDDPFNI